MKIEMFATPENGQGIPKNLGTFESIEDIEILCGAFDKGVVISFVSLDD